MMYITEWAIQLILIFIKLIYNFFFNWNSTWEDRHSNENENKNAELKSILRRLLSANEVLQHSATIRDLVDEHSTSVFVKIASKIFEFVEIIHENITTDEILPSLSLVVTVIFILIGGTISHYKIFSVKYKKNC